MFKKSLLYLSKLESLSTTVPALATYAAMLRALLIMLFPTVEELVGYPHMIPIKMQYPNMQYVLSSTGKQILYN
jgi:hypothetical protein